MKYQSKVQKNRNSFFIRLRTQINEGRKNNISTSHSIQPSTNNTIMALNERKRNISDSKCSGKNTVKTCFNDKIKKKCCCWEKNSLLRIKLHSKQISGVFRLIPCSTLQKKKEKFSDFHHRHSSYVLCRSLFTPRHFFTSIKNQQTITTSQTF